jgi:hypothetical protein
METSHLKSTLETSLYINTRISYVKISSDNEVQHIPNCGLSGSLLCVCKNSALVKLNARRNAVINLRIVVNCEIRINFTWAALVD